MFSPLRGLLAILVVLGIDLVPGKSRPVLVSVEFGDFSVSSFAMGVGQRRAAAGLKRTPGKL